MILPLTTLLRGVWRRGGLRVGQKRAYCVAGSAQFEPPWDILFFGTDDFSVKSLEALHTQQLKGDLIGKLDVVSVSLKKPEPGVRRYCRTNNLTLHTWPLSAPPRGYHVGVVVSFGHLIPSTIINAFHFGIVNVHGSLLPRWRGAAPVVHALLNNDSHTGVTIMRIQPRRFDVGSIISQAQIPITWDAKCGALTEQLADIGARELVSILHNLPQRLNEAVEQSPVGVTKAPKVSESSAQVDWNKHSCRHIQAMYRALDDHFPLWALWQGTTQVRLRGMVMNPQWSEVNRAEIVKEDFSNGKIMVDKNIVKRCDSNLVECDRIISESGDRDFVKEKNRENNYLNELPAKQDYILDTNSVIQIEDLKVKHSQSSDGSKHEQIVLSEVKGNLNMRNSKGKERDELNSLVSLATRGECLGSVRYDRRAKVVRVRCSDGWVSFREVLVKGKKPMTAKDFHNGFISKVPKDLRRFS